jgi:secondary thiamine-phosphate synthase enzyme
MQKIITISSSKRLEMIDINDEVEKIVKESKIKEGVCNIFCTHATAAIAINENYDPNVCEDFNDALSKLIPRGKWRHDSIDGNADAHIKAAIIGPSETVPIKNKRLQLGQWQSIMFVELDGPRSNRNVIVTIIGE